MKKAEPTEKIQENISDKIFRVINSCKTPEQMTVAGRYLERAKRCGYIHGMNFQVLDLAEINQ